MDFIQGFDRHQIQMISFDSFLRPDSWARVVDYFVESFLPVDMGLTAGALEENGRRVEENPEYYRLRQQIVEDPFGTLKHPLGYTCTLLKCREHILSEVLC